MSGDLTNHTLVFVGAGSGEGGVGDYAQDFLNAVRSHFGKVIEIRTDRPGATTMKDLRLLRRAFKAAIKSPGGPIVVHFELSAGAVSPFWLLRASPAGRAIITATVHDPPYAVWWPFRFAFLAKRRLLNHGLHFPFRKQFFRIERRQLRDVQLFALSDTGAASLEETITRRPVIRARHYIPSRPDIEKLENRPLAIGLYGYAYKGKGFDSLSVIRDAVPNEIEIVVAGRGTEKLPPIPGVTILGALDDFGESVFFSRIRCILLPYDNNSRYGEILSVSGVVARSFAFGTPVVARSTGTLPELQLRGGMIASATSLAELARQASELCSNDSQLTQLGSQAQVLRQDASVESAIDPYLRFWRSA